ncbi:MAG: tetratricopeptide repeat protein, partial [Gammaproteobacteria bacterium]|nr:tetratricopeptide repeat protein [Gammaproteobacteria bacterium]
RLLQLGQLERARPLFEQVLERDPHNADALQFFGLFCFQSGEVERARRLIEGAISQNPRVAPYHDNLGKVLEHQGALDDALSAYRKADSLEPGVADRHYNMGVVLQRLGRLEEAEREFETAIDHNSNDADYHFNLGIVLKDGGRYADAAAAYRTALSLKPNSAKINNNLGNALLLSGDIDGAVEALKKAVTRSPGTAQYHNNLGNALRTLGELDAAASSYRRALEIDSKLLDAHRGLGGVLLSSGRAEEAARASLRARTLFPESSAFRRGFAAAVRHLEFRQHDAAMEDAIHACISAEDVDPQELARVAAAQLRLRYGLGRNEVGSTETLAHKLAADDKALRLLERTVNVDPTLEAALTRIRRWLIGLRGEVLKPPLFRLACALARQCFSNEYVFEEQSAETQALEALQTALGAALSSDQCDQATLSSLIVSIALYRPLYLLETVELLEKKCRAAAWPEPLESLIERSLMEPREEARLEKGIESLKRVSDPTSIAVRAQYESHPYPRWFHMPERDAQSYGKFLRSAFPYFEPSPHLDGAVQVLVAGCGTGLEAIAAATRRECAGVVAVDLSRASLAYALRSAKKLGVNKADFVQADILDLPSWGRRFEVIESSGVLHHLAEPMRGWQALTECLLPGGVMKVGLYSDRARRAVVAARDRIRELDLGADIEGIRRIRAGIFDAGEDDPVNELKNSEDLYTTSACRDLLFHVCEHRFNLNQIRSALNELGLRLVGFELPSELMRARFQKLNPGKIQLDDLDAWARVEARYPDTFAAMYVFWCEKPG